MSLLFLKLMTLLVILVISLLGGLLPIRASVNENNIHYFRLGDRFASGIFLGAALFHMLPDANMEFAALYHHANFPIINLLCVSGFLLLMLVEQVISDYLTVRWKKEVVIIPYILAVTLSLHSIFAGIALGINTTVAMVAIIFIAIIAHKGSESFALGFNLKRHELPKSYMTKVIVIFSIMTPIGILLGSILPTLTSNHTSLLITAIIHAITAGTFLYIATVHGISKPFMKNHEDKFQGFFAFTLGTLMMGCIALWM